MSVLHLSKHLIYDLWYNNIKARYGDKSSLLYNDTDSLTIQVKTDAYKDMHEHKEDDDFSEYPDDSSSHNKENK